jgi:hypothetical protein
MQINMLFHQKKNYYQVNSSFILILWLPNLSLFFWIYFREKDKYKKKRENKIHYSQKVIKISHMVFLSSTSIYFFFNGSESN